MKNILVPIDFTDVGVNALRYALSAFPDAKITAYYVKAGMLENADQLTIHPHLLLDKYWLNALTEFLRKELKISKLPDRVTISIGNGPVILGIKNYASESIADAIVMGTRDKYNFFEKWFGTVSVGTVKTVDVPVYLIPKYATFTGFEKVMVASDKHLSDESIVNNIKDWNKSYGAFIKFLHIQNSKDDSFQTEAGAIVSELFEKNDPEFSFEVEVLEDKDVSHSLLASAYDMKADLLVVTPDDQNFLQSLLFASVSKDLILKSDLPLLFLKK